MSKKDNDVLILEGNLLKKKVTQLLIKKDYRKGIIANIIFLITLCRELQNSKEDLCLLSFRNEDISAEIEKLETAIKDFSEFIAMNYPL